MEVTTSNTSGLNSSVSTVAPTVNDAVISSDFDTFIKMLTAQIRNQDPLNPIESSDFAVQLATFSSVEQQVKTNDLLAELGRQSAAQSVGQLSSWVGLEARAVMPVVFDGTPLKLSLTGSDAADKLELVVKNSRGTELQRLEVPRAGGDYLWNGHDSIGNLLPSGAYMLTTQAFAQNVLINEEQVAVQARVVEAGTSGGDVKLTMSSGQTVRADAVIGVRVPEG